MLNKKSILLVIAALLSITSLAVAQGQEIKEYKVQQGDTLWDISQKELQDPFLWPKVWKENPEIANPDKLQPGQIIKIPLYLIQKEEKREEPTAGPILEKEPLQQAPVQKAEPAPVPVRPLVEADVFLSSGYITSRLNNLGYVSGSPSRKNLLGTNDFIYLTTKTPAKIGDRFYVVRTREVMHPAYGTRVGDLVQMLGVAEVSIIKQGETVATILKSYDEVVTGDLLIPYSVMSPPVVPKPYRRPKVEGYIVAARDLKKNNAMFDIVYLDKGKHAGLEVGDVLRAISVEKQWEGFTTVEHKYPHGIVQLIRVDDSTSVAVIRQSIDSVLPGFLVIQYD